MNKNDDVEKRFGNLNSGKNRDQIAYLISFIKLKDRATVSQMLDELDISRQALYKNYLTPLLEEEIITKFGKPPKVYYSLSDAKQKYEPKNESKDDPALQSFLQITPTGEMLIGAEAFSFWCNSRGYNPEDYLNKYQKLLKDSAAFKDDSGLINANTKMVETFGIDYQLKKTVYVDFYANEIFGKTALGQLVLYAKQSQSKKLIKMVIDLIQAKIDKFIKNNKIDAVCFVPPSIKRDLQFMTILNKNLVLSLPRIKLSKIKTDIITPQKTLSKLTDRIANANRTIIIDDQQNIKFNRVLVIDDAVGSGASLNEVARRLKIENRASDIYGLAVVGSKKGFDVISEV